MKTNRCIIVIAVALLAGAMAVGGCVNWTPLLGKHQKEVQLNAALASSLPVMTTSRIVIL